MKPIFLPLAACLVACTSAMAQPMVNGNVISWPDDGWYQVQNEIDYTEVCGGGSSCMVEPGSYVVINHTSGQRFPNIVVGADSDLAPPTNLRGVVYSNSAMELFWDRSPGIGVQYELTRDGQVVYRSDGLSFFASGLDAGVTYDWQLRTINAQGLRSKPASIALRTAGGQPAEPVVNEPVVDDNTNRLPGPGNVTVTIYSDTTAELFWTPPTDFPRGNAIVGNVIERDGVTVATLAGGNLASYFDFTRNAGTPHTYRIIVNYANGESASSAPIQTQGFALVPDVPVASDLLTDEERRQLNLVFDIFNASAMQKVAAVGVLLADPVQSNFVLADEQLEASGNTNVYDCPGGGTLTGRPDPTSNRTLDECRIGSLVFSARYFQVDNAVVINSANLLDTRDNSRIEFNLGQARVFGNDVTDGTAANGATANAGFAVTSPEGDYSVGRLSYDFQARNFTDNPNLGSATIAENISGLIGSNARLQTLGRFNVSSAEGMPTTGTILVSSDSADTLRIDANSGNPDTFLFTSNVSGAVVSYELAWTDDWSIKPISLTDIDTGE